MNLSIAVALLAFGLGALIFFKSKCVDHRVLLSLVVIALLGGRFLYDNGTYLFDYCRHPGSYVESSGTMMYRGQHHRYRYASLSYYEDDEVRWATVPVAFYEELPKKIAIKIRPCLKNQDDLC